MYELQSLFFFFFLRDPAPPEFSPLPLHAALPIGGPGPSRSGPRGCARLRRRQAGAPWRALQPPLAPPSRGRLLARGRCERRDRKSTRLNSSHLVISYAVFCLKKKNSTATCADRPR